ADLRDGAGAPRPDGGVIAMQDRPTALELLRAVREFLEADVLPSLDGRRRFHGLVAVNVLAIVEREIGTEEAQLEAQLARLAALPGIDAGERRVGQGALRERVHALETALVERIRRGDADADPFRAAVRAHVRATVEEKLAVANPRFRSAP